MTIHTPTPLRDAGEEPDEKPLLRPLIAAAAWSVTHPARLLPLYTPGMLGLPYRAFRLPVRSANLAAWHIPCPGSRRGLVLCHGHDDCRTQFLAMLRPLHAAGFHLLLFDHRSMGFSPGLCSYGFHEQEDALTALRWLREEAGVRETGLYGISMGGATSLLAAAQDPEVRAIVTDSAFARLDELVERRFQLLPPSLRRSVGGAVRARVERQMAARVDQVSPEAALRHWQPRPLLVIHGTADLMIPVEHGHRLAAAAGPSAELWIIPGAWHARCRLWARREYPERVARFFREHV